MRSELRAAVDATRHPGHLSFGALSAILTFAATVGVESIVESTPSPLSSAGAWFVAVPVLVVVGIPPLVGIYASTLTALGREGESDGDAPERSDGRRHGSVLAVASDTVRTLRDRGATLAAGAVAYVLGTLVLGLAIALALHAIVLGVLTGASVAAYALGGDQLVDPRAVIAASGVLFGLGLSIGALATRFFDCIACFTDASPIAAVVESVRFARSQPRTFAAYAVVTTLVFWLPTAVLYAVDSVLATPVAVGLTVLAVSVCVTWYAAFHAVVFDRRVVPVLREPNAADDSEPTGSARLEIPARPLVDNPVRLALVVLLLTGLLVGTSTIRALDVRPMEDPEQPGPLDDTDAPAALFSQDSMPTATASHRANHRTVVWNDSTDSWSDPVTFAFEHDVEQRRLIAALLTGNEETMNSTGYFSTKHFALSYEDGRVSGTPSDPPPERAWFERTAGNWTVYSGSGYLLVAGEPTVAISDEFVDQSWTVQSTSAETVVLSAEGADIVPLQYENEPLLENSSVAVTLDRETGYVTRIEQEVAVDQAASDLDGPVAQTVVTVENWETHEIDRPAEIEGVTAMDAIWAIAYY